MQKGKHILVPNKHRLLTPLDQRNKSTRLGNLRSLVDNRNLEIHFPQDPQPCARARREHDLCGLDAVLGLLEQLVVLVHVPSYASVDRVVLEGFIYFEAVCGDAEDPVVGDDVFFGVQFDEPFEDIVNS